MKDLKWCDDCQCEVVDCEHYSKQRKLAKIREIEAQWAEDDKSKAEEEKENRKEKSEARKFLDDPDAYRIKMGIRNPDGSHGERCICGDCMRALEMRVLGDTRLCYVVDGLGVIRVFKDELEDFLAQYPEAREVK